MLNVKSVAAFISTIALATRQVEGLITRAEYGASLLVPPRGSNAGDARRLLSCAPRVIFMFNGSN